MATRYATLVTTDDGEEEVSNIQLMEGAPPEPDSDAKVEEAEAGVQIGMIRGGPRAAVGGFGFRDDDARGPIAEQTAEAEAERRDEKLAAREVERQRQSRAPSAQKQAADNRVSEQRAAEKKAEAANTKKARTAA
jgi:hypothetical protein